MIWQQQEPRKLIAVGERIAFHEAGHLVVAHFEGFEIQGLTLRVTTPKFSSPFTPPNVHGSAEIRLARTVTDPAAYLRQRVHGLLAGVVAQNILFSNPAKPLQLPSLEAITPAFKHGANGHCDWRKAMELVWMLRNMQATTNDSAASEADELFGKLLEETVEAVKRHVKPIRRLAIAAAQVFEANVNAGSSDGVTLVREDVLRLITDPNVKPHDVSEKYRQNSQSAQADQGNAAKTMQFGDAEVVDEVRRAAYHEAGHLVVAHTEGFHPNAMEIHLNGTGAFGVLPATLAPDPEAYIRKRARVLMAGALAQGICLQLPPDATKIALSEGGDGHDDWISVIELVSLLHNMRANSGFDSNDDVILRNECDALLKELWGEAEEVVKRESASIRRLAKAAIGVFEDINPNDIYETRTSARLRPEEVQSLINEVDGAQVLG